MTPTIALLLLITQVDEMLEEEIRAQKIEDRSSEPDREPACSEAPPWAGGALCTDQLWIYAAAKADVGRSRADAWEQAMFLARAELARPRFDASEPPGQRIMMFETELAGVFACPNAIHILARRPLQRMSDGTKIPDCTSAIRTRALRSPRCPAWVSIPAAREADYFGAIGVGEGRVAKRAALASAEQNLGRMRQIEIQLLPNVQSERRGWASSMDLVDEAYCSGVHLVYVRAYEHVVNTECAGRLEPELAYAAVLQYTKKRGPTVVQKRCAWANYHDHVRALRSHAELHTGELSYDPLFEEHWRPVRSVEPSFLRLEIETHKSFNPMGLRPKWRRFIEVSKAWEDRALKGRPPS